MMPVATLSVGLVALSIGTSHKIFRLRLSEARPIIFHGLRLLLLLELSCTEFDLDRERHSIIQIHGSQQCSWTVFYLSIKNIKNVKNAFENSVQMNAYCSAFDAFVM